MDRRRQRALAAVVGAGAIAAGACGIAVVGGPADTSFPADASGPTTDAFADPKTDGVAPPNDDANTPPPPGDGGQPLPPSCAAVLLRDPTKRNINGFYDIDPDGFGGADPIHVYCDLTLDNGGWTLVGRSAMVKPNDAGTFGWNVTVGRVDVLTAPYSLGVVAAKITFAEILVGDRDPMSAGVHMRAFKVGVPADFLSHQNTAVPTTPITVFGDCSSSDGGPQMLHFAGATSFTDTFFFRDLNDFGQHRGLRPEGFSMSYPDCQRAGMLDGMQGLVFVR